MLGDMDFKIAGTREGITGIQLDCKPAGIPLDILIEALGVASEARQIVIDKMEAAIPSYRSADSASPSQPHFGEVEVEVKNLGKLIGPKFANVKEIEATTAGLYQSNPVDPQLESAWFQPLSLPLDPS